MGEGLVDDARMGAVQTTGVGEDGGQLVGQMGVVAAEQTLRAGTHELVAERQARSGAGLVLGGLVICQGRSRHVVVGKSAVGGSAAGKAIVYVQSYRHEWGGYDVCVQGCQSAS